MNLKSILLLHQTHFSTLPSAIWGFWGTALSPLSITSCPSPTKLAPWAAGQERDGKGICHLPKAWRTQAGPGDLPVTQRRACLTFGLMPTIRPCPLQTGGLAECSCRAGMWIPWPASTNSPLRSWAFLSAPHADPVSYPPPASCFHTESPLPCTNCLLLLLHPAQIPLNVQICLFVLSFLSLWTL